MSVKVTYDELGRVAALLEGFAKEADEEAAKSSLAVEDRRGWLSDATAYATAAKRLRDVQLET